VPRGERFVAVLGLGLAGFLAWLAYGALAFKLSLPTDIAGTPRYVAGEWAGHVADMAWVAVLAAAAAWLTGACLRRAAGIPVPLRQPRPWVRMLRIAAIVAILLRMSVWSALGGHGARFAGIDMSVDLALLHGLALCVLAGFELPAWVTRGVRCLAARIPALVAPRAALGELPATGRVRVAGTVDADGLHGGVAYHRAWDAQAQRVEVHGQAFKLRDGGHRVWIDIDPARAVVDAPAQHDDALRAGDRVEVIGHLVESAAAAVFVAAPLSLMGYWLVARWHLG
jgi:hypothetical protein